MKRRVLLPALVGAACLLASAPVVSAAPTDDYTSPDRRTGALPFVKIDGMTDAPAGEGMTRYTQQKVRWESCAVGECASILAPMDYSNPDGVAITLRISRKKATAGPRIGSLLLNPGGPGAAGLDMPSQRYKGLGRYDLVGFDPRGTGESTPVRCAPGQGDQPDPAADALSEVDTSPDDDAEYRTELELQRTFGDACVKHSGVYLQMVTTEQVVQDMDLIRQLLGDEKLHYVGYSYGTYLGATYANYYPDRVGRMVLDSPVDISGDESVSQAVGFDRALGLFAEWAAKRGRLGRSKEKILADLGKKLDELDTKPVKVGERQLTQSLAVTGLITFLYGTEEEWRYLEGGLRDLYRGDGSYLLQVADSMNDRQLDGSYGPMFYAFPVMSCADNADKGLKKGYEDWAQQRQKAPFFGKYFGPSVTCEQWPVAPQPLVKLTAPTSAPILVVGSTGDPATPYEYAPAMAKQLGSGVLLTWDGPGHGTYGGSSSCINDAVNAYLVDGKKPDNGKTCKP